MRTYGHRAERLLDISVATFRHPFDKHHALLTNSPIAFYHILISSRSFSVRHFCLLGLPALKMLYTWCIYIYVYIQRERERERGIYIHIYIHHLYTMHTHSCTISTYFYTFCKFRYDVYIWYSKFRKANRKRWHLNKSKKQCDF